MVRVTYMGQIGKPNVYEYFSIYHNGWAGEKARKNLFDLMLKSGIKVEDIASISPEDISILCNRGNPPLIVTGKPL